MLQPRLTRTAPRTSAGEISTRKHMGGLHFARRAKYCLLDFIREDGITVTKCRN